MKIGLEKYFCPNCHIDEHKNRLREALKGYVKLPDLADEKEVRAFIKFIHRYLEGKSEQNQ